MSGMSPGTATDSAPAVRTGVIGLFVERPVLTLMTLLAILVIGAIGLAKLPLRFMPEGLSSNSVRVWINLPMAMSPEEVRDKVVEPAEELVRTIPGLRKLRSSAESDGASLNIELDPGMDPSLAASEIRDRLQRAMLRWPRGVDRYFTWKEDGSAMPLAFVQLLTPARDSHWDALVDEVVRPKLEAVDGVGRVQVWGLRDERIKVWFDEEKLASHGLEFAEVMRKLQADNFTMPAGELHVEQGRRSFLLRVESKFRSTQEITDLPLAPGVRVGDVATVGRDSEVRDELSRYDQQYTYMGVVYAAAQANPVAASDALRLAANELESDPRVPGIRVRNLFDQGDFIRDALANLVSSAVQGGLLALAVLWLFLRNLAMTAVISVTIPLTLLTAGAYMFFAGDSLDICTMAGLTLSIGMVVDNSVVVVENIRRLRESGMELRDACIQGAREVGLAVTVSTLTTVVVFFSMVVVSDRGVQRLTGAVGRPLCVALLASLVLATVLLPSGMRMLRGGGRLAEAGMGRWSPLRGVLWVNRHLLDFGLRHRALTVLAVVGLLSTGWFAFQRLEFAGSDMDVWRRGDVSIQFQFPRGYSMEDAEKQFIALEQHALQHKAEWGLKAIGGRFSRTSARLELYLDGKPEQEQLDELRKRALASLPPLPGIKTRMSEGNRGGMGGGSRTEETDASNFVVRLYGRDSEYLMERAAALSEVLGALPEVATVEVPALDKQQEVLFRLDRDRMVDLGISPDAILSTMSAGLLGREVGKFEEAGRELRLIAQYDDRTKPDMVELRSTQVRGRGGAQQQLSTLGSLQYRRTLDDIESVDGRVNVVVVGKRAEGVTSRAMSTVLSRTMEDFGLAQGYSWSEESVQRESQAQMTELLWAVLLSIVLIMLLMAILFESVIQPLAILVTVPLAIWGALWALVLVLGTIDPMAVIGLLLLGGVVVNNGIVLLDHIVRLRAEGWSREDAIREGVAVRMRPVFMTASTTFVGLMPMVLFGERDEGLSYVGLSVAVAFGLAFSTIFTAVAVPIAYSLADDYVLLLRASFQRALGRTAT
ncbi:MAG: hypothetical protein RL148_524 [Planctomycetota bacterium]